MTDMTTETTLEEQLKGQGIDIENEGQDQGQVALSLRKGDFITTVWGGTRRDALRAAAIWNTTLPA